MRTIHNKVSIIIINFIYCFVWFMDKKINIRVSVYLHKSKSYYNEKYTMV